MLWLKRSTSAVSDSVLAIDKSGAVAYYSDLSSRRREQQQSYAVHRRAANQKSDTLAITNSNDEVLGLVCIIRLLGVDYHRSSFQGVIGPCTRSNHAT